MANPVSMSGNLPAGDGNGLSAIISDLIRDPKKMHVCIAIVDGRKITTDADSGDVIPTARIRRIEVISDAGDMKVARRLMTRALDHRTGQQVLPYDLESELDQVFGGRTMEDYASEPAPDEPFGDEPQP